MTGFSIQICHPDGEKFLILVEGKWILVKLIQELLKHAF